MTSSRILADKPDWTQAAAIWPNRQASQFIEAGGLRWHVQIAGSGPALVLIHGTGAATHSWGGLLPLLADQFTVIAPDLPGHGFTSTPKLSDLSLPAMAAALAALLTTIHQPPVMAIGHSAGAAILTRMTLDGLIKPQALVSLCGALLPLRGLAGTIFSPVAQLFARTSLVPRIVGQDARRPGAIERLINGTGSQLTAEGVACYRLLVQSPGHVAAAINMMANWDLRPLQRDLPRLSMPLWLMTASNDQTVSPSEAKRVQRHLPSAKIHCIDGLGHLAHEEDPTQIAAWIKTLAPA